MAKQKLVTVAVLRENASRIIPSVHSMYCEECGEACSANPRDYWDADDDLVFECCGEPMVLVQKTVCYEIINL